MSKKNLFAKLREGVERGLSVYGLTALIDECTGFLRVGTNSADDLIYVFAFRGALQHIRWIVDDEGFPEASHRAKIENQYWPLLRAAVNELDGTGKEALGELLRGLCTH